MQIPQSRQSNLVSHDAPHPPCGMACASGAAVAAVKAARSKGKIARSFILVQSERMLSAMAVYVVRGGCVVSLGNPDSFNHTDLNSLRHAATETNGREE